MNRADLKEGHWYYNAKQTRVRLLMAIGGEELPEGNCSWLSFNLDGTVESWWSGPVKAFARWAKHEVRPMWARRTSQWSQLRP